MSLLFAEITHAEMFSLTPLSVMDPGTLGSTNSSSETDTSSFRRWY